MKAKNIYILFAITGIIFTGNVNAETNDLMKCTGPSLLARFSLSTEVGSAVNRYRFVLRNDHEFPISGVALGSGKIQSWPITPGETPSDIKVPTGWGSLRVYEHEGDYMTVFWYATERASDLLPGKELGGFEFSLPHSASSPKELPFQALLSGTGGRCV